METAKERPEYQRELDEMVNRVSELEEENANLRSKLEIMHDSISDANCKVFNRPKVC